MLAGLASAGIVLGRSIQYERESGTRRMAIRLAGSMAEELRALDREPAGSIPADAPELAAWSEAAVASLPDGSTARVELAPGMPRSIELRSNGPSPASVCSASCLR